MPLRLHNNSDAHLSHIDDAAALHAAVQDGRRARASLERFASLTLDLLCVAGFDGYFKDVNPAWTQILGWSEEELLAVPYVSLVHPDDVEPTNAAAAGLTEGKTVITFENRYRCKDGSYKWLMWTSSPDVEEQVVYAAARDITSRKSTQEAIRHSEERYRCLTEATAAIVWSTPANGHFDTEQPGWSEFTGQTFHELRGWGWLQAIHPDDQAHTAQMWSKALEQRVMYQVEHRLRRRDGKYRSMMARAVPVLEPDGQIREWIGVHTDISDHKEMEDGLRRNEERYRSLALATSQIVWSANAEGQRFEDSPSWRSYTGQSLEEWRGWGWVMAVHPDDRKRAITAWAASVSEKTVYSVDYRIRKADGSYGHFDVRCVPVLNDDGSIREWIGTATDITARHDAEAESRRMQIFVASIVDNIPHMVFVKDAENLRFVRLNKAGERLLGTRQSDLLGKSDFDIFPAEEAEFFVANDRAVLASGRLLDIPEEPIMTPDGIRYLHTKKIPILDDQKVPRYLLGISEDITDRQQAKQTHDSLDPSE